MSARALRALSAFGRLVPVLALCAAFAACGSDASSSESPSDAGSLSQGKAYGFPYDDVGGYSSYVSHDHPQYMLVAIGW
jgi:hypothetical protein